MEHKENVAKNINWINFKDELKKHTQKLPKEGYVAKDMCKFYSELNDAKHDDKNFVNAHKLAK